MDFNLKPQVVTILITQFIAFAIGYIELSHKVKFHDAWIQRRIDVAEKIARLEERMRITEEELNQVEERLGRFQKSNRICFSK
jgi:hypothetical protein